MNPPPETSSTPATPVKTKPLLFLTGFLGAGKTTLLRNLLLELKDRGRMADVILNDFANADLDAATLPESTACNIAPIAASCACCDSLDDLMALCASAGKSEGDLLLIELNGTADPLALFEAFTLLEDKLSFFPRWQVGVVDARHWGARQDLDLLEKRQLETAGYWLLSHEDAVPTEQGEAIGESVRALLPHAFRITPSQMADALVEEIEGNRSSIGSPFALRFKPVTTPAAPSLIVSSSSIHDPVHHLSHRFTGCQVPLPPKVRRESILTFLKNLPDWVIRAKALVSLVDAPGCRWLFQRSGFDPIPPPLPTPDIEKVPPSLVCVGAQLDPEALREMAIEHFGNYPERILP